ncbi:MAG TPA: hypothetical protein VM871_12600 [Flavisolibacter sp.]|jgi:uncharacterized membrane protein|nr:hypothetical protein [Flavisolibacter sp.]
MVHLSLALFIALAGWQNVRLEKEAIRVYQTPNLPGSITVQSKTEIKFAFFLFNLEGGLVYQKEIKNAGWQRVEGLSVGTYTYYAFQNDKQLKGGKVELKIQNQ